jgi:hypothetical protein
MALQEVAELSDAHVRPEFEGLHALDITDAIVRAIDAPREKVHGDVLNVGSTEQNYTIRDIAKVVDEVFTGCGMIGEPSADHRGHRVALDEIRSVLPSFDCAVHAVEIRLVEDANAHRANRGRRVVEQPVDVEPCVKPSHFVAAADEHRSDQRSEVALYAGDEDPRQLSATVLNLLASATGRPLSSWNTDLPDVLATFWRRRGRSATPREQSWGPGRARRWEGATKQLTMAAHRSSSAAAQELARPPWSAASRRD